MNEINCESFLKNINILFSILNDKESENVVYFIIKKWFILINSLSDEYRNYKVEPNQYFSNEIISSINNNETFVDVGACDGYTIKEFLIKVDGTFNKIIAYEISKRCFSKLNESIQEMEYELRKKINLYNLGAYDVNSKVNLYSKIRHHL